jgi:hypothetical protein
MTATATLDAPTAAAPVNGKADNRPPLADDFDALTALLQELQARRFELNGRLQDMGRRLPFVALRMQQNIRAEAREVVTDLALLPDQVFAVTARRAEVRIAQLAAEWDRLAADCAAAQAELDQARAEALAAVNARRANPVNTLPDERKHPEVLAALDASAAVNARRAEVAAELESWGCKVHPDFRATWQAQPIILGTAAREAMLKP